MFENNLDWVISSEALRDDAYGTFNDYYVGTQARTERGDILRYDNIV